MTNGGSKHPAPKTPPKTDTKKEAPKSEKK